MKFSIHSHATRNSQLATSQIPTMRRHVISFTHGHRSRILLNINRAIVHLQLSSQSEDEDRYRIISTRSLSTAENTNDKNIKPSILSKEAATAPIDYPTSQRLWALPPAIAIHLSIGSVYVYSMWTPSMAKALGKVLDT